MKSKPRDKIITIEKIYEEPKLLKEGVGEKPNFYSFGIKLSDGNYANINVGAEDVEEAKSKAENKFIVNPETKERIKEGKEYKLYEESTDEAEKYWRVTAFVSMDDTKFQDPELKNKSDKEIAEQAPKETMKDVVHKESKGEGGVPQTYGQKEDRRQLLIVRQSALNYATQLATVFVAWRLKNEEIDLKQEWDMWETSIKLLAKEYEEQVMRK